MTLTSIEICAGAGGQALGLEQAGFDHLAVVEIDHHACNTLRENRPQWNVIEGDVVPWIRDHAHEYRGVDLVAGGVPCPPFSYAGKQLGADDERDLFPAMIELVSVVRPRAIMIENVRGLLDPKFDAYRASVEEHLAQVGYSLQWKLLNASDFGVPQLRPRVIAVGFRHDTAPSFEYPSPFQNAAPTVGETLADLMAERGWEGAHKRIASHRLLLAAPRNTEALTWVLPVLGAPGRNSASTDQLSHRMPPIRDSKGHPALPSEWLPASRVFLTTGLLPGQRRTHTGRLVTLFHLRLRGPSACRSRRS